MFQKKQKLIIAIACLFLIFSCFSLTNALETDLPEVGGVKPDETTKLPDYIKYLFNFSIAISGIVALGVIVWSGIKILMSPDQPETRKDARAKMTGALLGILVLLSSYLILTTINPRLAFIGLDKELKPVTGIYLIKGEEKEYIAADTPKVTLDGATEIEILSNKDELLSVFVYGDVDYKGQETPIKNTKESTSTDLKVSVSSPKSIVLIWNRPGIYLYPKVNFEGRPRYFNTSISNFSSYDFNKKAKSVEFIKTPGFTYGAVFFTQSNYRGKCGFDNGDITIADIEVGSGAASYVHPIGTEGLSSFLLYNFSKISAGNVIFYDKPNCTGNEYQYNIKEGTFGYVPKLSHSSIKYSNGGPVKDHIISFKINGNYGILLSTKEDFNGLCQVFFKPSSDNCYPSIESSYMWDPEFDLGPSVGSYAIIPGLD